MKPIYRLNRKCVIIIIIFRKYHVRWPLVNVLTVIRDWKCLASSLQRYFPDSKSCVSRNSRDAKSFLTLVLGHLRDHRMLYFKEINRFRRNISHALLNCTHEQSNPKSHWFLLKCTAISFVQYPHSCVSVELHSISLRCIPLCTF